MILSAKYLGILELFDLLDEISFFVVELLVFIAVRMEIKKKLDELFFVT